MAIKNANFARAVSTVLIASTALSGTFGCVSNSVGVGHPLSDPTAESERLHRLLADGRLSDRQRYEVRVRIAETDAERPGYRPALSEYEALVRQNPSSTMAKISFARATAAELDRFGSYYTDPNAQQAVVWMSNVIQKHPDSAENYLLRARCRSLLGLYASNGQNQTAREQDVVTAAKLKPDHGGVLVEQGRIALTKRDMKGVEDDATGALQSVDLTRVNASAAHYLLGVVAQSRGQAASAGHEYQAALASNPKNVDALYATGMNAWADHRMSDFNAAETRIAKLNSSHPMVRFAGALAAVNSDSGLRRDQAFEALRIAASDDPSNPVYPAMMRQINQKTEAENAKEKQWLAGAAVLVGAAVLGAAAYDAKHPGESTYTPPDNQSEPWMGFYDSQGYKIDSNNNRLETFPTGPQR